MPKIWVMREKLKIYVWICVKENKQAEGGTRQAMKVRK